MKKALLFVVLLAGLSIRVNAQTCPTCGGVGAKDSLGNHTGLSFRISLGAAQYGQSAGNLTLNYLLPDPSLFTPTALQYTSPSRPDITVITTNVVTMNVLTLTNVAAVGWVTNSLVFTNPIGVNGTYVTNEIFTNVAVAYDPDLATNVTVTDVFTTNTVIRQVMAPQALADIPPPPTANGYIINFYYPSQITGTNASGMFLTNGTQPFVTWLVTNPAPSSVTNVQISKFENVPNYGLIKQWTYAYSTNNGSWSLQPLGGAIQENMVVTNLDADTYQVINTLQSPSGPVVEQVKKTYQIFSWGTALTQTAVGSDANPEITAYTYPTSPNAGSATLVQSITHPDGSWELYNSYDANGNALQVFSSFGDVPIGNIYSARETDYTYTTNVVSGSGDTGVFNSVTPREVEELINSTEVSRRYTVFPAAGVRLDIQCTNSGASWNTSGNLVTTNLFYTNGPNQFLLMAVIRPDGTVTTYNYITNGLYQTNITVTGQPDSTLTNIVNGVSNVTVLNLAGYTVSAASYDVISGITLSADTYSDFDGYGRPQQVTHLDGTTEYTTYACCGLDNTVDRDGVNTLYLYDAAKRPVGYTKIYNSGTNYPISWQNTLDAAGRTVQSYRVGSDGSTIMSSQSVYDLANELIAQTNALGGVTFFSRTNDPTTGGLIRTTVHPDGGTVTNFYYTDGSLKETIGTGVHGKAYGYGAGNDDIGNACTYTVETNLNADGSLSSEWTKTYTDMAGRTTEVRYADGSYSQSYYNGQGQLFKQIDPDGVITLYRYNAKGELAYTAVDMNRNGTIDFSGSDRITQTTNDVTTDHSTTVRRTRNYAWLDGSSTGTLISSVETSTDGLNTWQTQYRDGSVFVTTHTQTVPGVSRTVTTTAPDGSYTVNTYSYGRLASSTRYDSTGTQFGGTTYSYDPHGRQNTMTDARNGTTTLGFNNADLVATNTTPNPGGSSPEVTITAYDNLLRPYSVIQPDGTVVSSAYLLTGELGLQYGSRTYPVGYSYDYAGRMQTMTNWSGFNTGIGARVTTWNYDSQRGFLTNKVYDGNVAGPIYSNTPAGRLASRIWARGIKTTYGYDNGGSLNSVTYSDSTPSVTDTYDRLGRLRTVVCNGMTDTLTNNLANELLGESFSGGVLSGLSVSNSYDADLRRASLSALTSGTQLLSDTFAYDNASRLASVTDGNNNSASYSYLANSPLVSQITFSQSSVTRMTTTKTYDYLNRLTQISSAPSASYTLPLAFNYNYNPANQRTKDTLVDGSYWIYGYDSLGQVTNACKYWADGTHVAGQQFDYSFDTIGNRTQAQSGGDQTGANLRVANYTNNTLNQITGRDVPAYVDVIGASILSNSVSVNGQTAYRKGEYFRQQLAANNSFSALWTNISVSGGSSVTGNVYVAKQPEVFSYDADGNLTNDGRWAYIWDGENRLVTMTVNTNVGPQYQLTFGYDYQGRRVQKIVATNSVALSTNKFLYDGWNLVAETKPDNSKIRTYMWGNDLSGSLQGAGGVGGLLEVSYYGSSTTNCFPAFDGNGNVAALINAADGTVAANYDYAAFGEPIRVTGVMAKNNPFRFSTKYADDESDLLYYGYRYYKPSTGTWPNRDRNQERGGLNLYGFVNNHPINGVDTLGLGVFDAGTWTFNVNQNGTPDISVDVFYTMDKSEKCRCTAARVDRYVQKYLGIWPGTEGNYCSDDTSEFGGYWDSVDQVAHAEGDSPDGPIAIWPLNYHRAWDFGYQWIAICTAGPDANNILSIIEKTYHTTGHWSGDGYYGSFSP